MYLARAIVSCGAGTPEVKIYFDHASHQSGNQRGWVDCAEHACSSCIKYDFVGTASRTDFLARLYIWYCAGDSYLTKQLHLQYIPSVEDIAAMAPQLVISEF